MTNQSYLTQALTRLGFTYEVAQEGQTLKTKGNYNVVENVDILITGNGKTNYNAAIGFKKQQDGTYVAIGDFYGLRTAKGESVSQDMLKQEVTAAAKEVEVNERLSALMFTLDTDSRTENKQEICFTMQRFVAS